MKTIFLIVCAFTPAILEAALITTPPAGATTTTFTVTGFHVIGGSSIVNGFQITATPSSLFAPYGDVSFGLGGNGNWDHFSLVGIAGSTGGSIQIDLGGLFSSVGQFMNYSTSTPAFPPFPMIAAIATDGATVLESYDLSVSAPISTPLGSFNQGAFRGISRGSSDIRFLRVSGVGVVTHDITVASEAAPTAVPEPSTLFLSCLPLTALFGISLVKRR